MEGPFLTQGLQEAWQWELCLVVAKWDCGTAKCQSRGTLWKETLHHPVPTPWWYVAVPTQPSYKGQQGIPKPLIAHSEVLGGDNTFPRRFGFL